MSQIRRLLSSHVSWLQLLPALQVKVRSRLLPAIISCPLCRALRMSIFSDAATGGQWHYCDGCGASGDMLQLAQAVWRLSLPATILKLQESGCDFGGQAIRPAELEYYGRSFTEPLARLRELWEDARVRFIQGRAMVTQPLQTLRLRSELVGVRLAEGPARMLGATNRERVELTFQPNSYTTEKRHMGFTSENRVFRGPRWKDVLAMPFYDLPQRIIGFLFAGREGLPTDLVYKRKLLGEGALNAPLVEAGLAFHPEVLRADEDWEGAVLALQDPILATRLQQRQFQLSAKPLPLVAWRDDGKHVSNHAWQMFQGRRIVFWAPEPTPEVVRQLLRTDAWLALGGDEASYWKDRVPRDQLRRVLRAAQPWQDELARWLKQAEDAPIENLFRSLQAMGEPTNKLLEKCRPSLRSRVAGILKQELVQSSVSINRTTVIEQTDGWFSISTAARRSPELICDACLRIERVIHRPTRKESYYQGYVLYKNEPVQFCERREVVEKHTLRWMQDLLLCREKGLLRYDPQWMNRIVTVATQLHPPEFVTGVDAVGWDDRRMGFTLPQFSVSRLGKVEHNPAGFFAEDAPGSQLAPPTPLSPAEAQTLTSEQPGTATAWGAATGLLANILAPAFGHPVAGLALVGRGAEAVGRAVARGAGCRQLVLDNTRKHQERLLAAEQEHRWPSYVEIPLTTLPSAVSRWSPAGSLLRAAVAPLDWLHAVPAQFLGSWRLLKDDASNSTPGVFAANFHKVVPAYLAYLLEGTFQIDADRGWLAGVNESLAAWLESVGGDPSVVRAGLELLSDNTPQGASDSFGDLLCRLFTDGQLAYAQPDFVTEKPALVPQAGGGLSVPKAALGLLPSKGRLMIEPLRVTEMLVGGELLIGETENEWIVPETWWRGKLHAWRAIRARLLRVKT